jgi:hypothetical protein
MSDDHNPGCKTEIESSACAMEGRVLAWESVVADELDLVVHALDVRKIVMGYALCVAQFVPK